MSRWRKGLGAVMAVGVALGLMAGPVQAASKGTEKAVKGSPKPAVPKAAAKPGRKILGKPMPPLSLKVPPARVAPVPPPPPREPVLLPVAIEEDPAGLRPGKVQPVRAYALDGGSFYHNGQLIRVQGLKDGSVGGEHARQRLQQLLDAGPVTVLPVGSGAGGAMLAEVRVNGRDVAEALAGSP